MNQGKARGKIEHIGATEQKTEKFRIREVVINIDGMYPQLAKLQASQNRCELLDNLRLHDEVEVTYELQGRKWEKQDGTVDYFTTVALNTITKTN